MFKTFSTLSFTTLFRSGSPFETGAVTHLERKKLPKAKLPAGLSITKKAGLTQMRYQLSPEDRVYGLGQVLGSLNRRGKKFRLYAKDDPLHTPDKSGMYGSHPFLFIFGAKSFGLFIDYPGEIFVDVGFTEISTLAIDLEGDDYDLYVFHSSELAAVVTELRTLTGDPYLPPLWAFGYQQCRYSYPDQKSVREVASKLKEHDIPCDAIYIDIDYMEDFKIFTVSKERFPAIKKVASELRKQGMHLIPIIDPGVRIEKGYAAYETGIRSKAFCVNEEGKPFIGAVWPGYTHLPDFLNKRARDWWCEQFKPLLDVGLEDVWNDMNEPAVFFTSEGIKSFKSYVAAKLSDINKPGNGVNFISHLPDFWATDNYYHDFFHTLDNGETMSHHKVHSLYGMYMAKASYEALTKLRPQKRPFVLTRSTYIGAHRYAALWTGDNHSWWDHMSTQMRMMISLNMIGFLFSGADVGGFSADSSPELVIRWTQLGVVTPLFRNHSNQGTRHQEPWAFDTKTLEIIRHTIRLRYSLIPYLYSEFLRAREEKTTLISPLFLKHTEHEVVDIEDQFYLGDSLMVAPVHVNNARSRFVYLPKGTWLNWNAARWDARACRVLNGGALLHPAKLDELPLFLRENTLLPLSAPRNNMTQAMHSELIVLGLVSDEAIFELRTDDGISIEQKEYSKLKLQVTYSRGKFICKASYEGGLSRAIEKVRFELFSVDGSRVVHTVAL